MSKKLPEKAAKSSDRKILSPLGAHIRKWRKKKGYSSSDDFAIKHNLGESWYGDIERGYIDIQFTTLHKIVNGLGVSYEEFFAGFNK
jgi:transcriptional regulator with XRE-family HTH domain